MVDSEKIFLKMGLETLKGDKAFYFLNEGEMFKGVILTHVDDFTMAGDETVLKKTREGIKTCMNESKVEENNFSYTNVDVERHPDGISVLI